MMSETVAKDQQVGAPLPEPTGMQQLMVTTTLQPQFV